MSRRVSLYSLTDWWLWNVLWTLLFCTLIFQCSCVLFIQCLVIFHLHVISFYIICNCFWPSPLLYTFFFLKMNGFAQLGSFMEMNGIAWGSMRWQSEEHVWTNAWFNPVITPLEVIGSDIEFRPDAFRGFTEAFNLWPYRIVNYPAVDRGPWNISDTVRQG